MEKLYKEFLLNKYELNTCTPEEYQLVMEWFLTAEGDVYLSAKIDEDLQSDSLVSPTNEQQAEVVFERIIQGLEPDRLIPVPGTPISRLAQNKWLKIAAVFAVCLSAGTIGYYLTGNPLVTYQTGYGKIRTVELPDHSLVTLNANSELRYRPNWNGNLSREVWLKGEAFFSVTHQKNHQKFFVHTSNKFNVEVLGTKFNVLDRQNQFQVVLNTGKIRLSSEKNNLKEAITMKPGQLIELKQAHQLQLKKVINTGQYSSWKNRILQFDQANLADISRILKDSYGLNLEISDSTLLKNHISGSVPMDNQDVLIEGISQLFHIRLIRDHNNIIIQH
ncbi:FecR family protein [Pedobacter sp. L105]|uniref:FecR family protein n=1 Tax=Pedobacter sp. L105 TaxID=1641871 RepID=UPI00131AAF0A|nr:FecR domain-containing protein [Pedobacter sp. L105]